MTTRAPAAPNVRSASIVRTAAFASCFVDVTTTPLPAARPSALTTTAPGWASMKASAAATSSNTPNAAVGTPASRISRFAYAFEPFDLRRGARRAEERQPGGAHRVAQPGGQRHLRSTHDQIGALGDRRRDQLAGRVRADRNAGDLRLAGDAGVAGRGDDLFAQRALPQLPGERVLPSARANEKDAHPDCS